jgi:hypothetical protein
MEAEAKDKPFDAMAYAMARADALRSSGPSNDDIRQAETRINGLRSVLKQKGYDVNNETSLDDVRQALANANTKLPNERGYFNPTQSGQYITDLKMLLEQTQPSTQGSR